MNYIFYSWQSDTPAKENRHFIFKALKRMQSDMKDESPVEIIQATGRELGSIDIPSSIYRNIERSDFFICDLTCLFSYGEKKVPNPNVMLELGYASAVIGWDRIVCLFNNKYSNYEDLPFDLRNRRIIAYSSGDNKKLTKELEDIYNGLQKRIGKPINLTVNHSSNRVLVEKFSLSDIGTKVTGDDLDKYSRDEMHGRYHEVLKHVLINGAERICQGDEEYMDWLCSQLDLRISAFGEDPQEGIDKCIQDYRLERSKRFLEILWRNGQRQLHLLANDNYTYRLISR